MQAPKADIDGKQMQSGVGCGSKYSPGAFCGLLVVNVQPEEEALWHHGKPK